MIGLPNPWLLIGTAVLGAASGFYVEHLRFQSAEKKWIADQAEAARVADEKAAEARDDENTKGYILAQSIEAQRQQLEKAYATSQRNLREVLKRPASCPASGSLGDVVIPGDALRELRAASGDDASVASAGPAASEPGR